MIKNQKNPFLPDFWVHSVDLPPERMSLKEKNPALSRVCRSLQKLQRDRTAGAFADAGTAFNAFAFIDLGLTVNDFDRFDGASGDADAATGAAGAINFSSHFFSP